MGSQVIGLSIINEYIFISGFVDKNYSRILFLKRTALIFFLVLKVKKNVL